MRLASSRTLLALVALACWPHGIASGTPRSQQIENATVELRSRRLSAEDRPSIALSGDVQREELCIVQRSKHGNAEQLAFELAELEIATLAYVPESASLVRGTIAALQAAKQLPAVEWIARYAPEDRCAPELQAWLSPNATDADVGVAWTLCVLSDTASSKRSLCNAAAERYGAEVIDARGQSPLCILHVPARSLVDLATDPRVLWIEAQTEIEFDLAHARRQMGADALELHRGLRGVGMRAEVYEGIDPWHPDFGASSLRAAPIAHGCPGYASHGTATFGILFGDGSQNPSARGLCPAAQGIWCDPSCDVVARFDRVAELVDPRGPYRAMLQTASWGHQRTRRYTAISAELDHILFTHDLVITQSQSNSGSKLSRPEAWAKNVIAVGGVYHGDNNIAEDDHWGGGSSVGPAEDGRWKPDFVGYYDHIETTVPGGYTSDFGGSSGATPMVAGAALLTQELFTSGAFAASPFPAPLDAFERRAHAATIKALLTASAKPYAFSGTHHDLTRAHQGWGFPNLATLDEYADGALVVDASRALRETQTDRHRIYVEAGTPALRVALTWIEPAALPSVRRQLVNDLDLEVRDPSGAVLLGNVGLERGPWSNAGGSADRINPTEAVFVAHPIAGLWTITVRAHRVALDAEPLTPAWDVPYSLVALGGWDQARRLRQEHASCSDVHLAIEGAPRLGSVLTLRLAPPPAPTIQRWLIAAPAAERWNGFELPLLLATSSTAGCLLGVAPDSGFEWDPTRAQLLLPIPINLELVARDWSLQVLLFNRAEITSTETWRISCGR